MGIRIPTHTHTHTDWYTQMASQLRGTVCPSVRRLMNAYECLTGSWFNSITVNKAAVELLSHSVVTTVYCMYREVLCSDSKKFDL